MRARWSVLGGLVLVGVFHTQACQSNLNGGPSGTGGDGGTAAAGTTGAGAAGATGLGGIIQDTGSANRGGGGIAGSRSGDTGSAGTGVAGTTGGGGIAGRSNADTGSAGTSGPGGTGGTGGGAGACVPRGVGGSGVPPCGPAATCDGDSIAYLSYCDQLTCSGPTEIWKRTPCGAGISCGGGKCLTQLGPPEKSCSIATDCGLPDTVCVGNTRELIYSDPSCIAGQCHWKEIVDTCGTAQGTTFLCMGGACYDPGMQTRGPITPTPSPDPMQPPPAPTQTCTTAAECTQPPPACFNDWAVSYVHGACRSGLCSWEINLGQCAGTCSNGACVGP